VIDRHGRTITSEKTRQALSGGLDPESRNRADDYPLNLIPAIRKIPPILFRGQNDLAPFGNFIHDYCPKKH
jgi:hypothetical protein